MKSRFLLLATFLPLCGCATNRYESQYQSVDWAHRFGRISKAEHQRRQAELTYQFVAEIEAASRSGRHLTGYEVALVNAAKGYSRPLPPSYALGYGGGYSAPTYTSEPASYIAPKYSSAPSYTGNTVRVEPDYLGGYRASDSNGNITRYRSDGLGGYRAIDDTGNVTRLRPDNLGGYRAVDDSGNVTRYHSDGLGGYRGVDENGNTIRIRPDGLGGYRVSD